MALTAAASGTGSEQSLRFGVHAVLTSYSQLLFSSSPWVGGLLLLATALVPRMLVAGLLSVLASMAMARALRLPDELVRSGISGYNALLVGLGGAALVQATPLGVGLVLVCVLASVLVTAALSSALGTQFGLPSLTMPFLLVFYLMVGVAPLADVPLRSLGFDPWAAQLGLPDALRMYLQCLGGIFFLPRVDVGLLVALGLLAHSRIAGLLSLVGLGVVALLADSLFVLKDPGLALTLAANCALVAIALGGVWFVPSRSSFALALGGVLLCAACTLGVLPWLYQLGLPVLILPFNLTSFLVLYAMRQRSEDGQPKAVDFIAGTPEQNLSYYQTRLARFSARYALPIGAPFLGRWTCTQGVDGSFTHQGPWAQALDFEVLGEDGFSFTGDGSALTDHRCYHLPVVASADGVVALVVDGIVDNPIGEQNLSDNWGNVVILYHAPGLYSCVAHLSPGTIRVREGQSVKRGDQLGLSGSSGRSPVPHLHFQLQASPRLGAPTLPIEIHDVVVQLEVGNQLFPCHVPAEGETLRNLEASETSRWLRFEHGTELSLATEGGLEALVAEIDLFGRLVLRSKDQGAALYYELRDDMLVVHDVVGGEGSVLHLVRAALSRLPFEAQEGFGWEDVLPLRALLPRWLRYGFDIISPFANTWGVRMCYRVERAGSKLTVHGSSKLQWRGKPLVATEAVISQQLGIETVSLRVRGQQQHFVAELVGSQYDNEQTELPPRWSQIPSLARGAIR